MMARTMMARSRQSAARAMRLRRKRRQAPGGGGAVLPIDADPAVEPGVGEVGEEVHDDEESAIDDGDAEQEVTVAAEDGLDEEGAGAGNVEDGLDDDGAGEKVGGERPEVADDGEDRDF